MMYALPGFIDFISALSVCVFVYREKFIRLQHENKMLRVQQEDSENERISELQLQLEEARRLRSELDTENRYHTGATLCLLLGANETRSTSCVLRMNLEYEPKHTKRVLLLLIHMHLKEGHPKDMAETWGANEKGQF